MLMRLLRCFKSGSVVDVIDRAQRGRQALAYDRPLLAVVPVPSRIELQTELKLRELWQRRFEVEFARFYESWVPRTVPVLQLIERTTRAAQPSRYNAR